MEMQGAPSLLATEGKYPISISQRFPNAIGITIYKRLNILEWRTNRFFVVHFLRHTILQPLLGINYLRRCKL